MGKRLVRAIVLVSAALAVPACNSSSRGGPGAAPPVATNKPPTVRLVSPEPDTLLQNGVAVDLVAEASDPDGSVFEVTFFQGATSLATVLTPPFRFSWVPTIDGTFSLTAVATDDSGASVSSDPVTVLVQTPGATPPIPNQPPLVRITNPLDGAVFVQGATITLSAEASDPDGPSLLVEYFDGATSIGTATLIPFLVSWTGATVGPHSIRAVATDAIGASTTSLPISITVTTSTSPPTTTSKPSGTK